MTKIAIISDIHANIDALNLVLKDIEKRGVDKIICLGDLVTKYFYPAEVVDAIKSNADIVLKGNCDHLVATDERYKFARNKLGIDRIEYLNSLPIREQILVNKAVVNLYHSTPHNLEAMFNPLFLDNKNTRYRDSVVNDYNKMFITDNPEISFTGHTHQDYIGVEQEGKLNIVSSNEIEATNQTRAIINVGSSGENSKMIMKNGEYVPNINPYLTYAIVDDRNMSSGMHIEIIKIPYKNTLKQVYFDMVRLQEEKKVPYSPNDTEKVKSSLINMGLTDDEIKRGR